MRRAPQNTSCKASVNRFLGGFSFEQADGGWVAREWRVGEGVDVEQAAGAWHNLRARLGWKFEASARNFRPRAPGDEF